ncbi:hypothetical protein SAMCFNEI73_Ch3140 [Sinorhizobium americanum]|uniref:Uncharacterized protein n=1 Tax=Sinorhizobium americanum TaxID=194963 RepID=A0A1L3LQN4_9HYPH|nr:hypothetical protein SAMCFNEI73_Ch3140 [Sinorhizobium americanum]
MGICRAHGRLGRLRHMLSSQIEAPRWGGVSRHPKYCG